MDKSLKILVEEIRYSYMAFHTTLYLEYIIKVDHIRWNFIEKAVDITTYDMNFENGFMYPLRKDYIKYALGTSKNTRVNWWVIWDMAIINTFSSISSNFKEILDEDKEFFKFLEKSFNKIDNDFDSFKRILNLIRSVAVHGTFSKDYTLKEKDFSLWKRRQLKDKIDDIKLKLNIDNKHELNLEFSVDDIKEWCNFSNIFTPLHMVGLIELCMTSLFHYEENSKSNV